MQNIAYVPQINYVVFELVKISIDEYLTKEYKAVQEETIYLAKLPAVFNYKLKSRDSIVQTDNKVTVNKFSFQPEHCMISGDFGYQNRLMAGTFLDGWTRLQQFHEYVVLKSKDTSDEDYIYGLNYYDFIWRKFGSININNFDLRGNARENAVLPKYSCEFDIVGNLIDVADSDLILAELKALFGNGGVVDSALSTVNDILGEINPILNVIGSAQLNMQTAYDLTKASQSFFTNLSSKYSNYSNVTSLF